MQKNEIKWGEVTDEYQAFTLKGVPFRLVNKNFLAHTTNSDYIVILKSKSFLNTEIAYFDYTNPRNMVEVGLFEGGSAIFWHLLYGLKYIGFDLRARPDAIFGWIDKLGIGESVSLHYGIGQDNEPEIKRLIANFMGDVPVDIVIDDASHQYEYSRRSFEILFPLLRAGGVYCVEDWSWAHTPGEQWQVDRLWRDRPALSNLIFDLTMLLGSCVGWFQQIVMTPLAVFAFSSGNAPRSGISLDKAILKQGRKVTLL
jgi:cephalosporin hydroxylase